jgi:hypothetical protein
MMMMMMMMMELHLSVVQLVARHSTDCYCGPIYKILYVMLIVVEC